MIKRLILTCPPGFEDIVVKELVENINESRATIRPYGIKGRVLAEVPNDAINLVMGMRSIHHVILYIDSFNIESSRSSLNMIYNNLKSIDFSPYLDSSKSFRITTERIGSHDYTSIDIQRVAGQAIVDSYNSKVDLKGYDVEIRVDVIDNVCLVGICLTKDSLHKRGYRIFEHPAALKPTIAYSMIRLACLKEGDKLVDPMCGGGTIPIEAACYMYGRIKIYGFDVNPRFIEGAKINARTAGVSHLITFDKVDCKKLSNKISEVDKIVTNPPFGIRMEPKQPISNLYKGFAREAYKVLTEKGYLVIITLKSGIMKKALLEAGFSITHERSVLHGEINTKVMVAVK